MMPIAFLRSQTALELEETLRFGDLSEKNFCSRIRERVKSEKEYYKLEFKYGEIRVYGPRFILINGTKYKSLYEARSKLMGYIQ